MFYLQTITCHFRKRDHDKSKMIKLLISFYMPSLKLLNRSRQIMLHKQHMSKVNWKSLIYYCRCLQTHKSKMQIQTKRFQFYEVCRRSRHIAFRVMCNR